LTANFKAVVSGNFDSDVCQTAACTFMCPTVDATGEDRWVKVSVIIPKEASEENGTDGYALAQEYKLKLQAAEERAARAEAKAQAQAAKAAARKAKSADET
jgi:hypothetical protein